MDKQKLESLSRAVVRVYLAIEDDRLRNVAKEIGRDRSLLIETEEYGEISLIESWQAQRLNDLNELTQDNIRTIAKYAGTTVEEVEKTLRDAGYGAVREIEGDMKEAAERGILQSPGKIEDSERLLGILETMQGQARDQFNLINTTLLDQSQRAYIDILNQTTGAVLAGVMTPQQALRRVTSDWAHKGVPALVDRAGRQWSTEAYVGMVTRTMSNTIANEMQDARMQEYGVDLIEISSHAGARPKCAPYQGRIFSLSGTHEKYPPFSSTSYGDPGGLFGVNCGHVKYPYIEGVSKRTFKPVPEKENERIYEESQKQRYLERRIRQAKR